MLYLPLAHFGVHDRDRLCGAEGLELHLGYAMSD